MFTFRTANKIAIAKIAYRLVGSARRLTGRDNKVIMKRSGVVWDLDLSEGIDFSVFLLGAFEPRTIRLYRKLVKPGNYVADIGANIGAHTLPLAQLVGRQGKVFAFEPTTYAFGKLMRNIALNTELATRIEAQQTMLVASQDAGVEKEIYSSWPLEKADALHEKHQGKLMSTAGAKAVTFDEAITSLGLPKLDFIKLDVDGHEFQVLSGAFRTLQKFKPIILMELEPCLYMDNPKEFDDMIALLRNLGGTMKDVNRGVALPLDPQALRKFVPDGASRNVLIRF